MKTYTLYFSAQTPPQYLGADRSEGGEVVTAEATPCQVAIIGKAIHRKCDLNVDLIAGDPNTVRVHSYPKPLSPQVIMSPVYHMPDGTCFECHADGSFFRRLADGTLVPYSLSKWGER